MPLASHMPLRLDQTSDSKTSRDFLGKPSVREKLVDPSQAAQLLGISCEDLLLPMHETGDGQAQQSNEVRIVLRWPECSLLSGLPIPTSSGLITKLGSRR